MKRAITIDLDELRYWMQLYIAEMDNQLTTQLTLSGLLVWMQKQVSEGDNEHGQTRPDKITSSIG